VIQQERTQVGSQPTNIPDRSTHQVTGARKSLAGAPPSAGKLVFQAVQCKSQGYKVLERPFTELVGYALTLRFLPGEESF
jgi:hypothetical protein